MSGPELVRWALVILTVAGMAAGASSLWEAWLDLRAVEAAGLRNGRRLIARAIFRAAVTRLAAVVILWFVGMSALLKPPGTLPTADPARLQQALAFLVIAVLVIADIICERNDRHELQGW